MQLTGDSTDVTVAPAAGSSTSASITAGQTATWRLTVTPAGGFTGTLAVSCTGAPAGMQCAGNPANVSVTNANPVGVTITAGPAASAQNSGPAAPVLALAWALPGIFFLPRKKHLRRLFLASCTGALFMLSACGAGNTSVTVTTPTTYLLNAVLTTSSGQTVTQPLVLSVTQTHQ